MVQEAEGSGRRAPGAAGAVSVFPTCFVEYMEPDVGKAIVEVYEHNGVACSLPEGTKCCGAPWLHSGNVEEFDKAARRNVAALASEVRAGRDVVVAQPTCAYVLKRDYPHLRRAADAELVAAHTYDPAEYLMKRHRDADDAFELRDEFPGRDDGSVPDAVTYHVACHLQAQNAGLRSRDLLKMAGVKCTLVQRCSGIDGTWGYRAENYELARKVAGPLAERSRRPATTSCAATATWPTGRSCRRPARSRCTRMQLMAQAYGIGEGGDGEVSRSASSSAGLRPWRSTLADVLDLRAYERVREEYRAKVIRAEAVPPGGAGPDHDPGLRVPRHRALPGPGDGPGREDHQRRGDPGRARHLQPAPARQGELSATLFIELTSDDALREWLPRLVGIERRSASRSTARWWPACPRPSTRRP